MHRFLTCTLGLACSMQVLGHDLQTTNAIAVIVGDHDCGDENAVTAPWTGLPGTVVRTAVSASGTAGPTRKLAAPTDVFHIEGGSCIARAHCVSSPHWPRRYGNNESCSIRLMVPAVLSATRFATEECGQKNDVCASSPAPPRGRPFARVNHP